MDFYLNILSISATERFRALNQPLYSIVLHVLAKELDSDPETVQNIFERMTREDE